jgi:hypothetical protein
MSHIVVSVQSPPGHPQEGSSGLLAGAQSGSRRLASLAAAQSPRLAEEQRCGSGKIHFKRWQTPGFAPKQQKWTWWGVQ